MRNAELKPASPAPRFWGAAGGGQGRGGGTGRWARPLPAHPASRFALPSGNWGGILFLVCRISPKPPRRPATSLLLLLLGTSRIPAVQTGREAGLPRCPLWGPAVSEGWWGTGPPPRHRCRGTDTCCHCRDGGFPHWRQGTGGARVTQRPPLTWGLGTVMGTVPGAEPCLSPGPAAPGVTSIISRVGVRQRVPIAHPGAVPTEPCWGRGPCPGPGITSPMAVEGPPPCCSPRSTQPSVGWPWGRSLCTLWGRPQPHGVPGHSQGSPSVPRGVPVSPRPMAKSTRGQPRASHPWGFPQIPTPGCTRGLPMPIPCPRCASVGRSRTPGHPRSAPA